MKTERLISRIESMIQVEQAKGEIDSFKVLRLISLLRMEYRERMQEVSKELAQLKLTLRYKN